jgi:hypothetical protein
MAEMLGASKCLDRVVGERGAACKQLPAGDYGKSWRDVMLEDSIPYYIGTVNVTPEI